MSFSLGRLCYYIFGQSLPSARLPSGQVFPATRRRLSTRAKMTTALDPDTARKRLESINEKLTTCSKKEREKLAAEAQSLTGLIVQAEGKEPAAAAAGSSRPTDGSKAESLAGIPSVKIAEGTFKYVLIKVEGTAVDLPEDVYFVRGRADAKYHYQCAVKIARKLENRSIPHDVTGGGRIKHDPEKKSVVVYGFSYQYGQADHSITCRLIQDHFGKDYSVTWNNEGY